MIAPLGEEAAAFEREFSQYLGVAYSIGVGSGTEALRVALDAWTIGHLTLGEETREEGPAPDLIVSHRNEQLGTTTIEAAVLEHASPLPVTNGSVS